MRDRKRVKEREKQRWGGGDAGMEEMGGGREKERVGVAKGVERGIEEGHGTF